MDPAPAQMSPWAEIIGPCFGVSSFARATDTTEDVVRAAAVDLSVLALTTADGGVLLPSFQVRDGRVVPHLKPILMALQRGIDDPWTWAQWLNTNCRASVATSTTCGRGRPS